MFLTICPYAALAAARTLSPSPVVMRLRSFPTRYPAAPGVDIQLLLSRASRSLALPASCWCPGNARISTRPARPLSARGGACRAAASCASSSAGVTRHVTRAGRFSCHAGRASCHCDGPFSCEYEHVLNGQLPFASLAQGPPSLFPPTRRGSPLGPIAPASSG